MWRKLIKWLLITAGVIVLLFIALLGIVLGPKIYYMPSEYGTANIIIRTEHFVSEHPGQWPRSWQELGLDDQSESTDFRFDLTPEILLHDRQLIYTAIQPKCHQYRTYPHAREHLDEVYDKLAEGYAAASPK